MQPVFPESLRSVHIEPRTSPLAHALNWIYVARELCPVNAEYRHDSLSALTLWLTEVGGAVVVAGERQLYHRPDALMISVSGIPLFEKVSSEKPWGVNYIMLKGEWADALGQALVARGRFSDIYTPAPAHWRRQFSELMYLAFAQNDGWEWAFLSECAALFGLLARYPSAQGATDSLLDEVERLVDADLTQTWSVEMLARTLGLTARQFGYRFGKAAGCSPALWLRRRRVAAARRLLAQGCSVTETSEALGFANPYHFSRVFKTVVGTSPSSLRGARENGLHTPAPLLLLPGDHSILDETAEENLADTEWEQ